MLLRPPLVHPWQYSSQHPVAKHQGLRYTIPVEPTNFNFLYVAYHTFDILDSRLHIMCYSINFYVPTEIKTKFSVVTRNMMNIERK
jgi:hypothetical protein